MSITVPEQLGPHGPASPSPVRRPGSVRRTASFDATWPDGRGTPTHLRGRARDLCTPLSGLPLVVAHADAELVVAPDRTVASVVTDPAHDGLQRLIDGPSISGYRAQLAELVPEEVRAASLLHLLLDDVPGVSLVSGLALLRWPVAGAEGEAPRRSGRRMTGICTGFQEGSSGLMPDGTSRLPRDMVEVGEVDAGGDVLAWHELPVVAGPSMRRARRIDAWLAPSSVTGADEVIRVDAFYQDSITQPSGRRRGVHEYTLTAEVDPASLRLTALDPLPRVLPHRECPLAVLNTSVLVGMSLADLRPAVLHELRGTAGCTHLNDMVRGLADVVALADVLAPDHDRNKTDTTDPTSGVGRRTRTP